MLGIEEVDIIIFQMEQILLAFKKSFSTLIIEKRFPMNLLVFLVRNA